MYISCTSCKLQLNLQARQDGDKLQAHAAHAKSADSALARSLHVLTISLSFYLFSTVAHRHVIETGVTGLTNITYKLQQITG